MTVFFRFQTRSKVFTKEQPVTTTVCTGGATIRRITVFTPERIVTVALGS